MRAEQKRASNAVLGLGPRGGRDAARAVMSPQQHAGYQRKFKTKFFPSGKGQGPLAEAGGLAQAFFQAFILN